MSHRHYCDWAGHDWQCSREGCECICGFRMEGHDHADCPVELRPCPEHKDDAEQAIAETKTQEPDPALIQKWQERPHCDCGCAESQMGKVVGFCLWCDHTYAAYNSEIEDRHFAYDCPCAPDQLRQAARARFAKH